MSVILDAMPFKQGRRTMYMATVHLSDLERFSIDVWDHRNVAGRRGYQRAPDEKRVAKIARYLERPDAIMPVAGLLNIRHAGKVKYRDARLTIPDGTPIWVVDMQHRLKGLVKAHDEGLLRGRDFRFPVVITEGLSQIDEAAQFYIINTRAKKMDVALTRRLLIENNTIKDLSDAKPWEIRAVQVTIDLNKKIRDNPWFEVIRQPNEDREARHVATEKSFVSSLRQLLIGGRNAQPHRLARRLARFWLAVRTNVPDPFQDPRRYLLQRTPGMFAFNFFIAPRLLNRYDGKDFVTALRGLKKLGPKFWSRRNKTGARRFGTGMAGYSNLADHVASHIGL